MAATHLSHSVEYAVYCIHSTVYSQQFTMYRVLCTVYTLQFILYSAQCAAQFTLCSLYNIHVHIKVDNIQSKYYIVYCNIELFAVYSMVQGGPSPRRPH